jgi:hypothetical protein
MYRVMSEKTSKQSEQQQAILKRPTTHSFPYYYTLFPIIAIPYARFLNNSRRQNPSSIRAFPHATNARQTLTHHHHLAHMQNSSQTYPKSTRQYSSNSALGIVSSYMYTISRKAPAPTAIDAATAKPLYIICSIAHGMPPNVNAYKRQSDLRTCASMYF